MAWAILPPPMNAMGNSEEKGWVMLGLSEGETQT
jgi:hypothetical protein